MLQRKWPLLLPILFVVVALVLVLNHRSDIDDMADEAERIHLRKIAESIYEYYALTGKWPGKADDLRKTSLASWPYDIPLIESRKYVVIWGRT